MDVLSLGSLRVRRVVKTSGNTSKTDVPLTVVLMHGYGAPGDDLVGLADVLAVPVGTTFLFPEAPSGLTGAAALMSLGDEGRAWWQIDIGWYFIATLEKLGLASDVNRPTVAGSTDQRQVVPSGGAGTLVPPSLSETIS